MFRLIAFACICLSIACTSDERPSNKVSETVAFDQDLLRELTPPAEEPYELKLEIEKSGDEHYLLAIIDFRDGSYTASPLSNNNFTRLFTISLEDNANLTLGDAIDESPRSVESIDPFEGVPVNWVKEKTTYMRSLAILSETDFDAKGLVSFTIEPRCTFEQIPFVISSRSKVLSLEM